VPLRFWHVPLREMPDRVMMNRENPVTSTGHADLIQDLQGNWWAFFLACRPYDGNYYNTGRETFMAPVKWVDGWPVINPDAAEVPNKFTFTGALPALRNQEPLTGNFTVRDEFQAPNLNLRWTFLRTPKEKWYRINPDEGHVSLLLRPETCTGLSNPSFIGRRQQHLTCSASAEMGFNALAPNEKAGLLAFQSEKHFYFLCKSIENGEPVVQLYRSPGGDGGDGLVLLATQIMEPSANPLQLKIDTNRDQISFYYALDGQTWYQVGENQDARFISTQDAGGFTGAMFAMYATSSKLASNDNWARFQWFEYSGNDDIK
jgi:alpha-N-arabinofuranosidase